MDGLLIRGRDPIAPGWRWLYSPAPANKRSAGGVGASTPTAAVSTGGITVFDPELSELQMFGGICKPGMGPYSPWVRRGRWVSPRGNYRRTRLAPSLAKGGQGERLGQWEWGSENAGMKVICLLDYKYVCEGSCEQCTASSVYLNLYCCSLLLYGIAALHATT